MVFKLSRCDETNQNKIRSEEGARNISERRADPSYHNLKAFYNANLLNLERANVYRANQINIERKNEYNKVYRADPVNIEKANEYAAVYRANPVNREKREETVASKREEIRQWHIIWLEKHPRFNPETGDSRIKTKQ